MIILKANQNRLIAILLDGDSSSPLSSSRKRESREWIPNPASQAKRGEQVGNDMGGAVRLEIILAGENSSVEVVGLVMGKGSEEKSLEAYITHVAPNTKSDVKVRAVLKDKSTFAFRGNVKIEKGAKGANAYLRSDALLFDDAKMGDDTPALEILEPDVKAGHAATIGKVDEQMLFYLMSRGLSRKQAEGMLVEGFISPIKDVIARNEMTKQSARPVIPALRQAQGKLAGI